MGTIREIWTQRMDISIGAMDEKVLEPTAKGGRMTLAEFVKVVADMRRAPYLPQAVI
jgi:hypothetical protein